MKQIIKQGTPKLFKATCPECGCEFTFMGEDMILKYSNNISEMLRFVMCPCCHGEVMSWKEYKQSDYDRNSI